MPEIVYFLFGLLLGIGFGWMIWGLMARTDVDGIRKEASAAIARARSEAGQGTGGAAEGGDAGAEAVAASEAEIVRLKGEIGKTAEDKDALAARVAELEGQLSETAASANPLEPRIEELETQLAACAAERSALEAKLAQLTASASDANPLEPRVKELEAQLADCGKERAALETKLADLAQAAAAPEPPAEPDEPEAEAGSDAPPPATLLTERPDEVDDLKAIRGVGPKMEEILNDKGIYLFRQLANFSTRDVEWVNSAIEAFPGRIERDEWVRQAQELYAEKYGKRHDAD